MDTLIDFIQGVGVVLGIIAYLVIFNIVYTKITGDDLSGTSNPLMAMICLPFVLPFVIIGIFVVLVLIGQQF